MSKTYNLSVINIAPDQYKDVINAIGESYGVGPNSLSVKLQDANGAIYWGCHSWWNVDDYAQFSDPDLRAQIVPVELSPSLEFLYERLVLDGDSQENWQAALVERGLSPVEIPE